MTPGAGHPDRLSLATELRAAYRGVLVADEGARPVRFVIDPFRGSLVIPTSADELAAESCVLFCPEERDDTLQLLLDLEAIDADTHAGPDRWRIYHGTPDRARWAAARPEAARWGDRILDVQQAGLINPLGADEPALCRVLNRKPDALTRWCVRATGLPAAVFQSAVAVGVDPLGVDVRGAFRVHRLACEIPPPGAASAGEALERLLDETIGPGAGGVSLK